MKQIALIFFTILTLAACTKEAPTTTPEAPPAAGFDERQGCSADAECVAVEIECCDHCNGGTVVGVHKDYGAEVRAAYAPPAECADQACTLMACVAQPEPICREGACGLKIGDKEEMTPLPRP